MSDEKKAVGIVGPPAEMWAIVDELEEACRVVAFTGFNDGSTEAQVLYKGRIERASQIPGLRRLHVGPPPKARTGN